jgi:hypothetical protein
MFHCGVNLKIYLHVFCQACEVALMELEQCLTFQPPGVADLNSVEDEIAEKKDDAGLPFLDDSAVFKIVTVNLLCINQLHSKGKYIYFLHLKYLNSCIFMIFINYSNYTDYYDICVKVGDFFFFYIFY